MGVALWLPEVLKDAGLEVKRVKGWRERGRPYEFDPIGVMFHHTASNRRGGDAPALGTVTHGRSDLPGPLCHCLISRRGIWYVVAAGYANHAGFGGPFRFVPENSGNRYFIGLECENDGIGEPWSKGQLESIDTGAAAILDHLDQGPRWLIGHKTWSPDRKIDPHPINIEKFQERVRDELRAPKGVRL